MAGRRRVSSFNPLSDNVQSASNDSWICVCDRAVPYYARADINSRIEKECEPGSKVKAAKDGSWLVVLDAGHDKLESGLYLPVKDPVTNARMFKNERVMLWEVERGRQRSYSGDTNDQQNMSRQNSYDSALEVGGPAVKTWHCVAEHGVPYRGAPSYDSPPARRCEKGAEVIAVAEDGWLKVIEYGQETGFFLPMTDPNSNMMLFHSDMGTKSTQSNTFGARRSFRWVDSEGMSHRMSHNVSGEHDSLGSNRKSEVWICVARGEVTYCVNKECTQVGSRTCKPGDKVNGIKEGSHIEVMQVHASMDMAEMLGRRSLKASTKFSVDATGEFLPFTDSKSGERLFKNEKLVLWEQASKLPEQHAKDQHEGNCSVM